MHQPIKAEELLMLKPSTPNKRKYQDPKVYPELKLNIEVQDNRDENHPRKLKVSVKI